MIYIQLETSSLKMYLQNLLFQKNIFEKKIKLTYFFNECVPLNLKPKVYNFHLEIQINMLRNLTKQYGYVDHLCKFSI
jgi:hypothetical protein